MKLFVIALILFHAVLGKSTKRQTSCGSQVIAPKTFSSKIVGGREANPHSWPWQVYMEHRSLSFLPYNFRCGGSLAEGANGEIVVVTAAHCTDGVSPNQLRIVVGVHSRSANEINRGLYMVSQIINHENYNANTIDNDIAILKLSTAVALNDYVQPICITNVASSTYVGNECVVTGWGTTSEGGSTSDKLQEVYKPVISDAACAGYVDGFIGDSMICAGFEQGGADACQGDSGGPFACKASTGAWDLVGIVSWGYGCARPENPGVYTDVHNYLQWISQKTQ